MSNEGDRIMLLLTYELWNCPYAFTYTCPGYFELLGPTIEPTEKICAVCNRPAFFCESPREFVSHGNMGHVVAVPPKFLAGAAMSGQFIGNPTQEDRERHACQLRDVRAWWRDVVYLRPQFATTDIEETARFLQLDKIDDLSSGTQQ